MRTPHPCLRWQLPRPERRTEQPSAAAAPSLEAGAVPDTSAALTRQPPSASAWVSLRPLACASVKPSLLGLRPSGALALALLPASDPISNLAAPERRASVANCPPGSGGMAICLFRTSGSIHKPHMHGSHACVSPPCTPQVPIAATPVIKTADLPKPIAAF